MPREPDENREEVISDFLQGGPRSEEWRLWREALEKRLADLKRERQGALTEEQGRSFDQMIEETETQIDALVTEEIITEFVESEIDLSLNTIEKESELVEWEDLEADGHSRDR